MTLSNEQRAELEALAPATVRLMLLQGGPGRGASISGFKCGDITKGGIDDWLIEKNVEEAAMTRGIFNYTRKTFYVAMAALLAAIVGIIFTILHS